MNEIFTFIHRLFINVGGTVAMQSLVSAA